MSSDAATFVTRRTALLGLLAVAGCGFRPAYAPGGGAAGLQGAVAVATPDTATGFALRTRLEERLGPANAPRFHLRAAMTVEREAAAISGEGDITRLNLVGAADWTLQDTAGAALLEGRSQSFTSYSATGSTVATQAAEVDARDRLAVILADMIVADLLAMSADLPA